MRDLIRTTRFQLRVAKLGRGLAVQGRTFVQPISLMQAERPITGQIAPILAVPVG